MFIYLVFHNIFHICTWFSLGEKIYRKEVRGWDGWMTSPTLWTSAWKSSRSWCWTVKPGVLQSMGHRVRHNWVTELVRKHLRKKEPPLRTVDEGLYWAVALGQNSRAGERGDKGSLRGMRGGERFYSQGRCPGQVFPNKEESAGYSGGWCPRAPCQCLLGPGCRGSVPGSLASLRNLSVAFFRGMPQHDRPVRTDKHAF